ncbi:MAG: D-aminoacylase [Cytophagales bacterium]|jgi:N-acyl-D-amino-acid deacylase|nr:D-aminoacylase [Cytophagales bacterium]MCA6387055.1 D-aminoacylase [Cytophagales bacterium]MCA6392007.1 D-aminoacylase [Cytophagales bacterium]MCA6395663.1 D-aminoacylase [Cytophagales bacterium]MCA6399470.1 D-aminoacylase [Cytophagales bacterium]
MKKYMTLFIAMFVALASCKKQTYDVIIRGGTVYDGSGKPGMMADVGMNADTLAFIGDLKNAVGKKEIDAKGLAVAPGFINMLSHAEGSLLFDGNSQSDIRQGVTLEVFGEGSMGPMNDKMKADDEEAMKRDPDWAYKIDWTTLGQYLEGLERKGISTNVASFVSAITVRVHELGYANRAPSAEELERMKALVKQAMDEGAMGVTSALIYAPANYASTEELIELSKVAAASGGMYIAHIRSEGNSIFEAVNETIRIAREAKLPAEIYHLKFSGKDNWNKIDSVIAMIDNANQEGLKITADMYTYTAGATGLDAAMPPWLQEGGLKEWIKRMQNPVIRKKALQEMRTPTNEWENLMMLAGDFDKVLLMGFTNDSLRRNFTGKTLGQVAKIYGKTPEETAMDLVITDGTRVGTAYFLMTEENVKRQIQLPYISFGSDAESSTASGNFLKIPTHPRAYGNFSRLLGKYVREEKVISLEEAIRRLTSLPASNLKIQKRGALMPGYFGDVAIFDPTKIADHATFENPHQYSTGMVHVFVNGTQVLENGEHTNARPGRVVRGPGWKKTE